MAKSIEYRFASELRAEGQGDEIALVGYAALFNNQSKNLGGFRETIAPGAFTRTLKEGGDVKALVNHDPNKLLGRVKNGTLTLDQDDKGLRFRVVLNKESQEHRDLYASIKRGDMDECSFAFVVAKDGEDWQEVNGNDDFFAMRTLKDVDLMDVSAVTYPAYDGTNVMARFRVNPAEVEGTGAMVRFHVHPAEVRSMVAKFQTKKANTRDANDCYEDMISDVCCALAEKFPSEDPACLFKYWVLETCPDYVIVCECGTCDNYFKISYTEDETNETYVFGNPEPMEKQWVPADRAQKALAEHRSRLMDMAAKHAKAAEDAANVAKAEAEAAAALKARADQLLDDGFLEDEEVEDNSMVDPGEVWMNPDDLAEDAEDDAEVNSSNPAAESRADKKVRTKKVGGKNLTKDKFAFVGDPNDTGTWKYPIHDADHVRNALARWGQHKGIPKDKEAGTYRKILAAAKKFGIEVSKDDSSRALAACDWDEQAIWERNTRLRLYMI